MMVSQGLLVVDLTELGEESFMAAASLRGVVLCHSLQFWKLVALLFPILLLKLSISSRPVHVEERLGSLRFVFRNVQRCH